MSRFEEAKKALREIDIQVDGMLNYASDPDKCHGVLSATRIQASWEGAFAVLYEGCTTSQKAKLDTVQYAPERQTKIRRANALADQAVCRRR